MKKVLVVIMFLTFALPMAAMDLQASDDDDAGPEEQMTPEERRQADMAREVWDEEMEEQELLYIFAFRKQQEQHRVNAAGPPMHEERES